MSRELEEWRDIEGYEGFYRVSNFGRIFSIRSNKYLKPDKTKFGHLRVTLKVNSISARFSVHRLVAYAFLTKINGKNQINHKNNIPYDNHVNNLEWCTPKENIQHASRQGRLRDGVGSKNTMACITESDVINIRQLAATKKYKQKEIANMFNLDEKHISLIVLRKRWKHI